MRVARQRHTWLEDHVHHYRRIARYWAINLRQYFAPSAATRCRRLRALRGSVARDEARNSTNCASCCFCKISTRKHGCPPFLDLVIQSDLNDVARQVSRHRLFRTTACRRAEHGPRRHGRPRSDRLPRWECGSRRTRRAARSHAPTRGSLARTPDSFEKTLRNYSLCDQIHWVDRRRLSAHQRVGDDSAALGERACNGGCRRSGDAIDTERYPPVTNRLTHLVQNASLVDEHDVAARSLELRDKLCASNKIDRPQPPRFGDCNDRAADTRIGCVLGHPIAGLEIDIFA